jgi:putative ABC transport system permease protein
VALPLYYNWRNVLARKLSTALTFVVVAVVVFVLALLLSFAAGIRASLAVSGRPDNLIVLKPGATAESTSILRPEEISRLIQTPGLAHTTAPADGLPAGTALLSPELCVQTTLHRDTGDESTANVAIRGVDDVAFAVHSDVRIVAGRRFRPGVLEVIVGRAARDRYAGLQLGDTINLGRSGNREYKVVGVFDAAGAAIESEIWAPRSALTDSYQRRFVSSVCLRVTSAAAADAAIEYVDGPVVQLEGKTETQYYGDLAAQTRQIVVLTTILIAVMAIGAIFAVANTMYSAVDGRRREIALLRTIGFGRAAIMLAFMIESLLICVAACASGLAVSLFFNGARKDYLSDATWTTFAYELRITPQIVVLALATAVLVGVCGALAPAGRAARINILQAVRKG